MLLERKFSTVEINRIDDELSHLRRAYHEESACKAAGDTSVSYVDFPRGWEIAMGLFSLAAWQPRPRTQRPLKLTNPALDGTRTTVVRRSPTFSLESILR
jgi:hypothetical protein